MILHKDDSTAERSQRLIQAGDLVIVYERHDSMKSVYVTPGQTYGNRYGNFKLKASWQCSRWTTPFICQNAQVVVTGLGWQALWQPSTGLWPKCHRLGVPACSHSRAMVTGPQTQNTDLVHSRHQHGLYIPGAQTWLYRFVKAARRLPHLFHQEQRCSGNTTH